MLDKILLYGAGGVARDIIGINEIEKQVEIIGIIDDNKREEFLKGIPIYTLEEAKDKFNNCLNLLITLGDPKIKEKIYNKCIKNSNISLKNYISNKAMCLSKNLGKGIIIYPYSFIGNDTIIGDNNLICGNVSIGHDVKLENYITISFNSSIGGNVKVGKNTYIGSGVNIRDEIIIGENVVIGMGSLVLKSIESDKIFYNKREIFQSVNDLKSIF